MKLTRKGQITIPIRFRRKYGLLPDTEVLFEPAETGVLLRPAPADRARRLAEGIQKSRGSANSGLYGREILQLTRGE